MEVPMKPDFQWVTHLWSIITPQQFLGLLAPTQYARTTRLSHKVTLWRR